MTPRFARETHRPTSRNLIAADVMTANPKSIRQSASVRDAARFLTSNGMRTAPVIDDAGRPVGVLSRTDLLDYWDRRRNRLAAIAAGELSLHSAGTAPEEQLFDLKVMEIMTPVVFSVPMDAPIRKVVHKIAALEVRCVFVTDEHGVLVGVISVFDLLRTPLAARDLTADGLCKEPYTIEQQRNDSSTQCDCHELR
jgi:CBS domain-containing protein